MMNKEYNDQFIATIDDADYEVPMPPFFADKTIDPDTVERNQRILNDALDVGIHEDLFDSWELEAAHKIMYEIFKGLDVNMAITNSEITAIARALCRFAEVFPEKNADSLLEDFRAYVNQNKREFYPGG